MAQDNLQSPLVEHCDLDTEIMGINVARVTTSGVVGEKVETILLRLKEQKYTLVYWQSLDDRSEYFLMELPYRGERYGTNIVYMLPINNAPSNIDGSEAVSSLAGEEPEKVKRFVRICTRYSHLSQDPRIEKAHVYALFDCWLQDGMKKRNNRKAVLSRQNNQVIGMAVYTVDEGSLHINLFAVSEELHRRGYGTELLHCILGEARTNGCSVVSVVTQKENKHSILFYENYGFKEQYHYGIYHFWL